ncbi:ADARB1 [Symbiodinium sp. CCMP2592]|nr:ADARB1 [Symbiodinium sp. CCMP2592]
MASPDVVVLSVKVAKQRKPRPPRKEGIFDNGADSQEPAGPQKVKQEVKKEIQADTPAGASQGQAPDIHQVLQVKDEVKEEVEERESNTHMVAQTKLAVKEDLKTEVKEEVPKNREQHVKTEIKEEQLNCNDERVKKEITPKDIKQEVKEEVSKDAHMEVKKESNEVVSSRRRMRTKAKAEIKHEMKQEDQKWPCQLICTKREPVDSLPVQVKQENFEQPGPKRRRLSQKSPDVSVPSFESRLTEWAEKCLAFQSSGKTWLPTKPCCPASPFLGLAAAPWQGCVRDTTTACVQLLGNEQFRELRDFYRENPHHALFHDNSDPSSEGQAVTTTAGSRPQPHRSSTGNQHRAAECMKMWPWMRDLPTRAWAGNGWLLVEDGMMKLSPTGGGSAMQGLEIFESVGSVPEPGEQKPLESTSQVEPRAEGEQVVTKNFRGLERQSGIQGIYWERVMASWRVDWRDAGKRRKLNFPISKHLKLGLSEGEALEAALEEAKAFREELVRLGKLKPPKPITEKASGSKVRGVDFQKSKQNWRVQFMHPITKKNLHGGYFKVKEEAEARARDLAKELGLQEELVPVKPLSELPHFEPLGPQKGIRWVPGEQAWHARCQGKHMRFRPKDFSPKEVEKAWKQAVAWRKQQEKDRAEQPCKR